MKRWFVKRLAAGVWLLLWITAGSFIFVFGGDITAASEIAVGEVPAETVPTGWLVIESYDAEDPQKKLGGIVFEVYTTGNREAGALAATVEADESGQTPAIELPLGTYYIWEKEETLPEGYVVSAQAWAAAISEQGSSVRIQIGNQPIPGWTSQQTEATAVFLELETMKETEPPIETEITKDCTEISSEAESETLEEIIEEETESAISEDGIKQEDSTSEEEKGEAAEETQKGGEFPLITGLRIFADYAAIVLLAAAGLFLAALLLWKIQSQKR